MQEQGRKQDVVLIVRDIGVSDTKVPIKDRGGGEMHGLKEVVSYLFSKKPVDPEKLMNNLQNCLEQVGGVLSNLGESITEGWELEGVSVGLAINAEGSVGIATVGVETTVEVNFTRKK
ncbi:hypothetical protein KA005_81965 [bacterium]|nr:hypothetical protein [bacterium]